MQSKYKAPIISVLMGVYFREPDVNLLQRSILSILAQSMKDFELLICDDGSQIEALKLIEALAAEDSRIRLIREGRLYSLPAKLNACLKYARGTYIARMDDDDFSHIDRFEKQLHFLVEHPDTAFVGCNVNIVKDKKMVGQRHFPQTPSVYDFLMTQPYIHPTIMFRKECLTQVGGYSEDRHCILCEDYDLLLRIYESGYTGANIQEVLFDYTVSTRAAGNRRMWHRWNEAVTRYRHFKSLELLPGAWPYVIKPLVVGIIPKAILQTMKDKKTL